MVTIQRRPGYYQRMARFQLKVPQDTERAFLVGSFNGWNAQIHELSPGRGGRWGRTLSLSPGRYEYKFLINHTQWMADPDAGHTEPDGLGGSNAVLRVL